ncbi:hypothetical protein H0O02_04810 [Candidatus Micrarchaeota archaeon]|nr:hypothetical protein [Candidatus Micrarchaeota archaeon]
MEHRQKRLIKASVSESVAKLLGEAQKQYLKGNKERSQSYVRMALQHIKKHKVRVPEEYRNAFCRKCCVVWVPGDSAKVFFDRKHNCLRIECRKCGFGKRL